MWRIVVIDVWWISRHYVSHIFLFIIGGGNHWTSLGVAKDDFRMVNGWNINSTIPQKLENASYWWIVCTQKSFVDEILIFSNLKNSVFKLHKWHYWFLCKNMEDIYPYCLHWFTHNHHWSCHHHSVLLGLLLWGTTNFVVLWWQQA